MKIKDTFFEIEQCFDQTGFCKCRWDAYISRHLPYAKETIEQDAADYDFEKEVVPVLEAVCQDNARAELLHGSFLAACDGLEERIRQKLHTELDVVIVLYLGLCNGAGWAIGFDGVPHVLLGVEKILELDWCGEADVKALLYHELGHLWHDRCRSTRQSIESPKERALWQLYREGVAMYCQQLLCEDFGFYHQDKKGWLDWCKGNRAALFREYIRVVEQGESHRKFFGDWNSYLGVSDIGYYLGCELIKKAAERKDLAGILDLSLREIEETLYACAE